MMCKKISRYKTALVLQSSQLQAKDGVGLNCHHAFWPPTNSACTKNLLMLIDLIKYGLPGTLFAE